MTSPQDLAALNAELEKMGIDPSQIPSGDTDPLKQEVTPPPLPNAEVEQMKGQLEAMRLQLEQARRYVPVENDQPRQPEPQQPNQQLTPRKYGVTEFAEIANTDPARAIKEALAASYGLPPGTDPLSLVGVALQGMKELSTKHKELENQLVTQRNLQEQREFLLTHEDYEPNADNAAIIDSYLKQNGWDATARNFHAAYVLAKSDGQITPKKTRALAEAQQPQQQGFSPARPPRVPSLAPGNATQGEPDWAVLQGQLDNMPMEKAAPYMEQIFKTFGK